MALHFDTGSPGPKTRAFVAFTLRNGALLWTIALILAVPALWRTAQLYLHLKSDIEALLPRESPSVIAVDELRTRMPGLQHLGVVVDAEDAANLPAAEKFIDDLAAKIRTYPPELARRVRLGDTEERAFLEKNAPLYIDVADLKDIRARIEKRRDYEVAHETGAALDDTEKPPPLDFSDIENKYKQTSAIRTHTENGRFISHELHLAMLLIEVGKFETGASKSGELLTRVKNDVKSLGFPQKYAAGMRVGYTGDVAISVEETSALKSDLSVSSVVVIFAVVLVLITYYRWWRSVLILIPPLLLAAVYAFGVASLPPLSVTELNSNTAFLGSIIVGNGINFGIILLARYVEERRRGVGVDEAMTIASWAARPGTLSAALAAGVSYASLALTHFRGFRQFGAIGGLGMIMSWAVAFVLMPPLAKWIDRSEKTAPKPIGTNFAPMEYVAKFVSRFPAIIATVGIVLTILAAIQVRKFSAADLEYDFSKLRRADTWTSGEGYWGRKMDALLGAYLTPTVILTDSPEEMRAVATAMHEAMKHPPFDKTVASLRTIDDVFPRNQAAKIEQTLAIRYDLTPKIRSLISEDNRKQIDRFLGNGDLKPITANELPTTFTTGLRERDGTLDRSVLVFPKPGHALWEGPPLEAFVAALRSTAHAAAPKSRVAGSLALSSDILTSIQHDGPIASASAFIGVVVVAIFLLGRSKTTVLVVASLVVGVLWLGAGTMLFGVKINFANFIAFPITFGIGVDYPVNIVSRYTQDGGRDVSHALRTTGGAVALCSSTTIIGYASLLLAQNRALYLFGLVAVMGEVACLTAAITLLPAVLTLMERRRARVAAKV